MIRLGWEGQPLLLGAGRSGRDRQSENAKLEAGQAA